MLVVAPAVPAIAETNVVARCPFAATVVRGDVSPPATAVVVCIMPSRFGIVAEATVTTSDLEVLSSSWPIPTFWASVVAVPVPSHATFSLDGNIATTTVCGDTEPAALVLAGAVAGSALKVHPDQLGLVEDKLGVVRRRQSLVLTGISGVVACCRRALGPGFHKTDQHELSDDAPLALACQFPGLSHSGLGGLGHTSLALAPISCCLRLHLLEEILCIPHLLLGPGQGIPLGLLVATSPPERVRVGEGFAVAVGRAVGHSDSDFGTPALAQVFVRLLLRCLLLSQTRLGILDCCLPLFGTARTIVHAVQDALRILHFVEN